MTFSRFLIDLLLYYNFISLIFAYHVRFPVKHCFISKLSAIPRTSPWRKDFEIFQTETKKPLIYLDSAATSHKPQCVIQKMTEFYQTYNSNVHRGSYRLSNLATKQYETSRSLVQQFIHAKYSHEIIFTRGATDGINLVSQSFGQLLQPGDEIILSIAEHHSNIVPWQILAKEKGLILHYVNLTSDGLLDMEQYRSLLRKGKTKIVTMNYVSNVLGTVNPVKEIINEAHRVGAVVLLDACQAVPHIPINVQELDVDFLVASGHKMCGPTGIGFLYGKSHLLQEMPVVQGGGEMIDTVTLNSFTCADLPLKFEAGTPPIAQAIGLGAACDYLSSIGMEAIHQYDQELGEYLYEQLNFINDLQLYGPSTKLCQRSPLVSFNHRKHHPTDIGLFLDQEGVAVRTGSHCTQPLYQYLNNTGSIRASLYLYNSIEEIDLFIHYLKKTIAYLDTL